MYLKLDLQFFAGEKTEKATPKKRQDERKKGKVVKSQDVNTGLLLLAVFIILFVFGSYMKNGMLALMTQFFTETIQQDITQQSVRKLLTNASLETAKLLAPVLIIAFIAGFAANLMQIGFLFTSESLKFDLKRIDPIKGFKRIFSIRAVVELLKSLLKISFIGTITFMVIWSHRNQMMMLAFKTPADSLQFFGQVTIIMGLSAILALLFLAVFDYAYQRYDYEKQMRMSKQDIKDEYKNIEGDPFIKSKIKERQRQMSMRRMMADVPKADVIITNPTHFAVAIKYDENKASAPYVLAKGADHVAMKIKEIARAHDIITIENRPLARSLYADVEIGHVIPEQFFQAVAEMLAYVYRLEKKAGQ
ncbi:flagellar biosynthesis protein FlhB [Virgibacillus halophilus]|uniref:flagellar biosynthesis protein FlhB n=1 Tax=Tigheibacillus halophilus TaxID=361280 RepID=UPI0036316BF0